MAEYDVNNMRNICVIGHGGDGKTSFCDAALFSAKTVERLGRVDNGTSKFDYDPDEIKKNLIAQLTAPVRWTQTIQRMTADGINSYIEVGPGKVLQGLVKKVNKDAVVCSC